MSQKHSLGKLPDLDPEALTTDRGGSVDCSPCDGSSLVVETLRGCNRVWKWL